MIPIDWVSLWGQRSRSESRAWKLFNLFYTLHSEKGNFGSCISFGEEYRQTAKQLLRCQLLFSTALWSCITINGKRMDIEWNAWVLLNRPPKHWRSIETVLECMYCGNGTQVLSCNSRRNSSWLFTPWTNYLIVCVCTVFIFRLYTLIKHTNVRASWMAQVVRSGSRQGHHGKGQRSSSRSKFRKKVLSRSKVKVKVISRSKFRNKVVSRSNVKKRSFQGQRSRSRWCQGQSPETRLFQGQNQRSMSCQDQISLPW